MNPSEEISRQPASMHKVLLSCLDLTGNALKVDPRPGSLTLSDSESTERGQDGQVWSDTNSYKRHLALSQKFAHEQAQLCRSLELLIDYPLATWDASGIITRAVAERAGRISWLLDKESRPRARFARALMLELRSVHERHRSTEADTSHPESATRIEVSQERYDRLRRLARNQFDHPQIDGDPKKWIIEGEKFKTTTDEINDWATKNNQIGIKTGLYQNMSTVSHPQGFEATSGRSEPSGGAVEVKPESTQKLVYLCVGIFHTSLREYLIFQNRELTPMNPLEQVIEEAFPGSITEEQP